jgi:erythromycin esterase
MKQIVLFLLAIQTLQSFSQGTLNWLQKNVIPISSTDQYMDNAKDYEPLKKILLGKDIILLGEDDHIFSTSLESKKKLVKFLHDQMGFTVLAFEYDFYTLANAYNKAVKENNPVFFTKCSLALLGMVNKHPIAIPVYSIHNKANAA